MHAYKSQNTKENASIYSQNLQDILFVISKLSATVGVDVIYGSTFQFS